jgi:hypothetical protein
MNTDAKYDDTTTTTSIDEYTRDVVVTTIDNATQMVTITIHALIDVTDDNNCPICWDRIAADNTFLDCNHDSCSKCIGTWAENHQPGLSRWCTIL